MCSTLSKFADLLINYNNLRICDLWTSTPKNYGFAIAGRAQKIADLRLADFKNGSKKMPAHEGRKDTGTYLQNENLYLYLCTVII